MECSTSGRSCPHTTGRGAAIQPLGGSPTARRSLTSAAQHHRKHLASPSAQLSRRTPACGQTSRRALRCACSPGGLLRIEALAHACNAIFVISLVSHATHPMFAGSVPAVCCTIVFLRWTASTTAVARCVSDVLSHWMQAMRFKP